MLTARIGFLGIIPELGFFMSSGINCPAKHFFIKPWVISPKLDDEVLDAVVDSSLLIAASGIAHC
jgi:hypothetical protein